jgi:hypothetical protein
MGPDGVECGPWERKHSDAAKAKVPLGGRPSCEPECCIEGKDGKIHCQHSFDKKEEQSNFEIESNAAASRLATPDPPECCGRGCPYDRFCYRKTASMKKPVSIPIKICCPKEGSKLNCPADSYCPYEK